MGGGAPPPAPPPPPAVAANPAASPFAPAPGASGPTGARGGSRTQTTLQTKGQVRPADAGAGPGGLGSQSVLGSNSTLGGAPPQPTAADVQNGFDVMKEIAIGFAI